MLENTPTQSTMTELLGQPLFAVWQELCCIEMAPEAEWSGVKAKYELPDEYVLYLGRVSKAKVDKLLPYFLLSLIHIFS